MTRPFQQAGMVKLSEAANQVLWTARYEPAQVIRSQKPVVRDTVENAEVPLGESDRRGW